MRQETISVYKFDELPEEVRNKVIDKNREINTDYEWYEPLIYDLCDDVKTKIGLSIEPENITFEVCSRENQIAIDGKHIIRALYRKNKKPTIIATGQTLEDARRHCQREDTHKIDRNGNIVWFDGYTKQ